VKVMAKDLIRTRHQIEKFYKLKSQLQGVSLRIQVSLACYYFLSMFDAFPDADDFPFTFLFLKKYLYHICIHIENI
jgi:hypothetical protein